MWSSKVVKTRKVHECVFCQRDIPKGTNASHEKGIWEGEWQNHYICLYCEKFVLWNYAEPQEGINGEEFMEYFRDTEMARCPECGNEHNGFDWSKDQEKACLNCDCGCEWFAEIPFEPKLAQSQNMTT